MKSSSWIPCLVGLATLLAGCGGGHHLDEYTFVQHSLAVVQYPPPAPELRTGWYATDDSSVVRAVIDAGSRAAKEVEGRAARTRLDSAARLVKVGNRMASRTLERASRYLGTTPVEDRGHADYLLELDVRTMGIDAREGRPARVYMKVEAVLLDRRSGDEIWNLQVDSHDGVTPGVPRRDPVPSDIVTAGVLTTLSVEDFRRSLEGLTDFTSDYITNRLRADLRDVRDDRRSG